MRTAAPLSLITLSAIALVASSAQAEIPWRDNLRTAHAEAQAEGKQLLLHFYTDNCSWCEKLEAGAFQTPQVHQSVQQHFVPVKVNAAENPKLTEMFAVKKFPTDVVVTIQGKTLSHSVSPQDPSRYVAMLDAARPTPATPEPEPALVADQTDTPGFPRQRTNEFALPVGKPGQGTTQLAASRHEGRDLSLPSAPAEAVASDSAGASPPLPSQTPSSQPLAGAAADNDASISDAPQPDAQQPELAIQGFCPVSVIEEDRWVEGNPDFGVIHLGRLYLFGSAEKMQTFLDDPLPYTPVMNEIDVVRFFEERRIVPGKREWGLKDPVHQRMFFFADESAMNHFWNKHELYTEAAVQVMDEAIQDANPGS